MTTVHARYEVGDSYCGVVDYHQKRDIALAGARMHETTHRQDNIPERVEVYDRMARPGATQLWTSDGRGAGKRPPTA